MIICKEIRLRCAVLFACVTLGVSAPPQAVAQDDACAEMVDTIVAALPAPPVSTYLPVGWELRRGVNVHLSAGVSVGSHRSALMSQQIAVGYAAPVGKHFTVAAGVSATHYSYGSSHGADITASASLAYQPNDRLNLYAWVQKSFTPQRPLMPPPAWTYYLDTPRDAVGFAAEYRIGDSAWLSVSFEASRYRDAGGPPRPPRYVRGGRADDAGL